MLLSSNAPGPVRGRKRCNPARARRPFFLQALLITSLTASLALAQDDDEGPNYLDFWLRGDYEQALSTLLDQLESRDGYIPPRVVRHRAQLRFATGRVDEAIADMEWMDSEYPEPSNTLDLALLYQYRGRREDYENARKRAVGQMQTRSWRYSRADENRVAIGRILELEGENPKTILSAYYTQVFERRPNSAISRVGAAQMALRKAGYNIAAKYFIEALDIEPENQSALAGLGECYWKSRDPRLAETLQALRALNPNHPGLMAIEVERLLDRGKADDALKVIARALEINPVHLGFRSLKSAAHFLLDDPEAMQAVQEEVLEFNPYCSEVFRTTGRLASRHYRFKEGAEFQRKALEIDASDHEARALYTQDLLRLGEEVAGRDLLEEAFEADPFNVHLFNLLKLMDTLATFTTIERGPFVLRLPEHEAPVLAEAALDWLDEAIVHFEAKYEVTLERPILVEMFDNHDDFMVRSVGLPGNAGHLGICFGRLITMDTPSARAKGSTNWKSVLWHEFMHVITLQKTRNRMPRWLSEGISVYEEGQASRAWRNKLDPDFKEILAEGGLPGTEDLDLFFTQPLSPNHLMFGYFIAGEFAQFYTGAYGLPALNAALNAIGSGVQAVDALAQAAETTLPEMNGQFHEYLEVRLKPYDNLPAIASHEFTGRELLSQLFGPLHDAPPHEQTPEEPPDSPFTDALKQADEARAEQNGDEEEAALKKAHALFPDYTADDAPLRALEQLYLRNGNKAARKQVLLEMIEWAPAEFEACKHLIELSRDAKDWETVARIADWALGIDPYDVAVYEALIEASLRLSADERALESLNVLTRLDVIHATDHKIHRAKILFRRGEGDTAKREVLEVLDEVPHFFEAQDLLLQIVERGQADTAGAGPSSDKPNQE